MPPSIWRGEQRDEKKRRRVSVSDKSTVARPFVCLTWPTIPVTCQYFAAHLSTQLFSPTLRSPSLYRVSMHLAKHEAVILYCAGKKMREREGEGRAESVPAARGASVLWRRLHQEWQATKTLPPSAAGGYSRIVQIHPVLHLELSHVEGLCLLGGGHVRVRRRRHRLRLRLRRMQEARLVQDFLVWTRQRCAAFQIPARKIQRDLKIQCMKRGARLRGKELKSMQQKEIAYFFLS